MFSNEAGQGALAVRRVGLSDARRIAEINVAGWRAAYRGLMPAEFLESISIDAREMAWRSRLDGNEVDEEPAWVAERGGESIGYVVSGPPRDDDVASPAAEVYAIYVHPSAWRSGAGRALLEAATAEWQVRGAAELVLWVLEGNAGARAFYEAMGWRADGSRKEYDMGGFSTLEVRYRLPLR